MGNEWTKEFKCDGMIIEDGDKITKPLGEKVRIDAVFVEKDKYSDKGSSYTNIVLEDGENETFYVEVREHMGAYESNKAIWKVAVSVKLIKKKQ